MLLKNPKYQGPCYNGGTIKAQAQAPRNLSLTLRRTLKLLQEALSHWPCFLMYFLVFQALSLACSRNGEWEKASAPRVTEIGSRMLQGCSRMSRFAVWPCTEAVCQGLACLDAEKRALHILAPTPTRTTAVSVPGAGFFGAGAAARASVLEPSGPLSAKATLEQARRGEQRVVAHRHDGLCRSVELGGGTSQMVVLWCFLPPKSTILIVGDPKSGHLMCCRAVAILNMQPYAA